MALPPHSVVFVGVDIGMTCTGVSICALDRIESGQPITPIVIQEWPGTSRGTFTNKVPTTLAYKAGHIHPRSWGFECPSLENVGRGMCIIELFKFILDPEVLGEHLEDRPEDAPENIDVKKWFTDFLSALYKHIVAHLEAPPWEVSYSTKIEYIFGLPTMWRNKDALIGDFRGVVKNAGFTTGDFTFRLTEAEASAVYTAKSEKRKYKKGDTIIVCDAGGGTTDICALKVKSTEGEIIDLLLLDEPTALDVGSVQIDEAFERHAERRLNDIRQENSELKLPEYAAHIMAKGLDFQTVKKHFPRSSILAAKIPVPGNPERRVDVSPDELRAMFDEQIRKILEHIDQRIDSLQRKNLGLRVSYIVLSGGLGSSKYVQTKIEEYYQPQGIPLLYSTDPVEPPLSVCKGLVIDRMQRLCHGISAIPTRSCETSYGILCSEPYDRNRHAEQGYIKNQLDGHKYAINRIHWFIRKGEAVTENEPIICNYSRMVSPDDQRKTWRNKVVTSLLPSNHLPDFLGPDVEVICQIVSDLGLDSDAAGVTPKRKHKFIGSKLLIKDYEILAFVEQRRLRFASQVNGKEKALKTEWTTQDGLSAGGEEDSSFQDGFFKDL